MLYRAGHSGLQGEPSHIFRNANGVFTDVTADSRVEVQTDNGRQVSVLDYNNDGLMTGS